MRCQICGDVAVINMPQHRLKLCEEHFIAWVERRVARTIEQFEMFAPDARLLVAVSGGKDSLALWEILLRLGYQADGLYINLGIGHEGYSDVSQAHAEAFAAARPNAALQVVPVAERYGRSIPELAHSRGRRACSSCGMIKRYIMNRAAHEGGYDAIVTGHNLDDEAAQLLQNNLYWLRGYLQRQAPVLPEAAGGALVRKAKPLCLLYERESAAYTLVRGIEYVQQECPYAQGATSIFHKRILNDLERRSPGTKLQYYLGFVRARQDGLIAAEEDGVAFGVCERCGQPTTANQVCAFCRMLEAEGLA
jgi:tRNA-5-methyluridine54 2-sulfurtransferase